MKKKYIFHKLLRTGIILLVIAAYITNTWIVICNNSYVIKWQHLTAVLLFIPLPFLVVKKYELAVLGTVIYLFLGLIKCLSLTAAISTGTLSYLGLEITGFNWLCFTLLLIFIVLHLDILSDIQLDYKERKSENKN